MLSEPHLSVLTAAFNPRTSDSLKESAMDDHNTSHCAALNRLLRHESTAVETYQRVIEAVDVKQGMALRPILDGHLQRAASLQERLVALGALADVGAGAWGVLMPLVDGPGAVLDPVVMVDTLAELEGHGVADYHREIGHLDDQARVQVEAEWLPAQERAVAAVATLRATQTDHLAPGPQS